MSDPYKNLSPLARLKQQNKPNPMTQFGFQPMTQASPAGQFGLPENTSMFANTNQFDPMGLNFGQQSAPALSFGLPALQQPAPQLASFMQPDQFVSQNQDGQGQFMKGGDLLDIQDNGMFGDFSNKDMLSFGMGAINTGLGMWGANKQHSLAKDKLAVYQDNLALQKQQYAARKSAADAVQYAR